MLTRSALTVRGMVCNFAKHSYRRLLCLCTWQCIGPVQLRASLAGQ